MAQSASSESTLSAGRDTPANLSERPPTPLLRVHRRAFMHGDLLWRNPLLQLLDAASQALYFLGEA